MLAATLGSFTESQAKTDYNSSQTLCLLKAKKYFDFMVVIKALERHFNLLFQHQFASGHKMKQGRGKGKRKEQTPLESHRHFITILDTAGLSFLGHA